MVNYLSTDTIKSAYKSLVGIKVENASILHIFLILKGCGYNRNSFVPLSELHDNGIRYCRDLSVLFSPDEKTPAKCDFINPFSMKEWSNNPTENMDKWMPGRVKNNILGGATTWRRILYQDLATENIKLHYNYLTELKVLTLGEKKLDLLATAIWANRFTKFNGVATVSNLCNHFIKTFNLTDEEVAQLFASSSNIRLEFTDRLHDTESIRSLIGNPEDMGSWVKSIKTTEHHGLSEDNDVVVLNMESNITVEKLKSIIGKHKQIILTGPPGTSKSYFAKELAKSYDSSTKIQFHPQYTYQQFVGGYVVEKDKVVFRKGVLLNLLDQIAKNQKKMHLMIIDEINRANASQVLGETIQCLDRDSDVSINVDGVLTSIKLPENLHIIATMNSSDRTIGSLDHAVRRRFLNIYCAPNASTLMDLCPSDRFISLSDFLNKINAKLYENLKNRELAIGHAFFLSDDVKKDGKFYWEFNSFEIIFNYRILPMIEEFCYGDLTQVRNIFGEKLPNRLQGEEFEKALKEYTFV